MSGVGLAQEGPDAVVVLNEREARVDAEGVADITLRRVIEIRSEAGSRRFRHAHVLYDPRLAKAELLEVGRLVRGPTGEHRLRGVFDANVAQRSLPAPAGLRELEIRLPLCQPGQRVAYAVRLTQEPPFAQHLSLVLVLGDVVPVDESRLVVTLPSERRMYWRPWRCRVKPTIERGDGVTTYSWVYQRRVDPRGPAPRIFLSTTSKWGPVRDWLAEAFLPSLEPTPAVVAKTGVVCSPDDSPRRALDKLLRFVREEIEEPEVALGPTPFEPQKPDQTLATGLGDCKAKVALLASMLEVRGIESTPCLLDLRSGVPLDEQLPSPYVFSHACLGVRLGDGTVWVDPTETAPLYHPHPEFDLVGLVLDPQRRPLRRLREVVTTIP
ncbi:MAG: DUF3857 domain-containing protein [Armatimonadota bacterium]